MPEKQIAPAGGADGYTDLTSKLPRRVDSFLASTTITAKTVVALNTDGTVSPAATNNTASLCIGIADAGASANQFVPVVTYGVVEDVPATGSVAASDVLKRSVTTTGSVAASATPAVGEAIGIAITASASNLAKVFVNLGR